MKASSKDRASNSEGNLDKLSRLKKRKYIVGDPEDLVHMDWRHEWTELKNIEPVSGKSRKKN